MYNLNMNNLEKTLKALANKRRLAIIKHLKENKESSVSEISDGINLSFRSTSRHLAILFSASILEKEQKNIQVFYRLSLSQESVAKHVAGIL